MFNKGALSLLADYGSDSSDDEAPGCRVSTKRMHRGDEEEPSKKRFERLPTPSFVISETSAESDDTALHGGRIRSFPHERGNWASYVYIPYIPNEGLESLFLMLFDITGITLEPAEDLHVSLSKTVVIKHHWIESLVDTLKKSITVLNKFALMFGSVKVYCNEERTRTFIGLQVRSGFDTLSRLVGCVDECFGQFNLPQFYMDPSFHMSIAWCVGDRESELNKFTPQLNSAMEERMNETPQDNWFTYVEKVYFKTGNKTFQFYLT